MRAFSNFALVACSRAVFAEDCSSEDACRAEPDHPTMLQIARDRGFQGAASAKKGFHESSKPYFAKAGNGLLGQEEEGMILINEDGVNNTYYLPGAVILDEGTTVKYLPPFRYYLMLSPTTEYSNGDNFYKPLFLGKTFTVDMDFGRDGPSCGCNLNFYLVDMPVGFPGKDMDYYCDAQCFPDVGCCAEFDMNEGNMNAQQVTNHYCTNEWACDGPGGPWAKTGGRDYGPGPSYTIDSQRRFTYAQKFELEGNRLVVTTTMSQDGREVVLPLWSDSKLESMKRELEKGMAFVTGYWHNVHMNWLDGEQCGGGAEHCNKHPAYISNWRLTSNGNPVPSPAPVPPTPTPPAPVPQPTPEPPTTGKCCWGQGCTSCNDDPASWCNQGDNCVAGCGGTWCSR
jgi:hypothetical protein